MQQALQTLYLVTERIALVETTAEVSGPDDFGIRFNVVCSARGPKLVFHLQTLRELHDLAHFLAAAHEQDPELMPGKRVRPGDVRSDHLASRDDNLSADINHDLLGKAHVVDAAHGEDQV